mmetsp:Transcript_65613/g.182498  ORF Transcript_65613/g.182498 Transcript_65613/m.182498 type:complete len:324 (+) Transcript_65613:2252-3223(+)
MTSGRLWRSWLSTCDLTLSCVPSFAKAQLHFDSSGAANMDSLATTRRSSECRKEPSWIPKLPKAQSASAVSESLRLLALSAMCCSTTSNTARGATPLLAMDQRVLARPAPSKSRNFGVSAFSTACTKRLRPGTSPPSSASAQRTRSKCEAPSRWSCGLRAPSKACGSCELRPAGGLIGNSMAVAHKASESSSGVSFAADGTALAPPGPTSPKSCRSSAATKTWLSPPSIAAACNASTILLAFSSRSSRDAASASWTAWDSLLAGWRRAAKAVSVATSSSPLSLLAFAANGASKDSSKAVLALPCCDRNTSSSSSSSLLYRRAS